VGTAPCPRAPDRRQGPSTLMGCACRPAILRCPARPATAPEFAVKDRRGWPWAWPAAEIRAITCTGWPALMPWPASTESVDESSTCCGNVAVSRLTASGGPPWGERTTRTARRRRAPGPPGTRRVPPADEWPWPDRAGAWRSPHRWRQSACREHPSPRRAGTDPRQGWRSARAHSPDPRHEQRDPGVKQRLR